MSASRVLGWVPHIVSVVIATPILPYLSKKERNSRRTPQKLLSFGRGVAGTMPPHEAPTHIITDGWGSGTQNGSVSPWHLAHAVIMNKLWAYVDYQVSGIVELPQLLLRRQNASIATNAERRKTATVPLEIA